MKRIQGIYSGTGSAMTIGLGFKPDFVRIKNVSGVVVFEWDRTLARVATAAGGVALINHASAQLNVLTAPNGIRPYTGGAVSVASANVIVPIEFVPTIRGVNYASEGTTWTLDTAANGTGHVSAALDTTGAGVGSKIVLWDQTNHREFVGYITALTSTGLTADYVTVSPDAPATADVRLVTYKYDFATAPAGMILLDGIYIADTTYCANSAVHTIEAIQY